MLCPPGLPGRAVCPALGPGGRWTPWHAARPPGASDGANEVGHGSGLPAMGRLGCRVGWWSACGWGPGMPAPSGQIPPPWAWWENEAPTTRTVRSPSQAALAWLPSDEEQVTVQAEEVAPVPPEPAEILRPGVGLVTREA